MGECGCGCGDVKARVKALLGDGNLTYAMSTVDAEGKPCTRWMGAFVWDSQNEWALYAASFSGARKMQQIKANPNMQLVFAKTDFSEVATLNGTAEIVDCLDTKKIVWDAMSACAEYFSSYDGEDFGVIKFTTKCVELLAMSEQHAPFCVEV
jgi:general stress protein 26